jgi:thiamine biosynthesis lipoprotein
MVLNAPNSAQSVLARVTASAQVAFDKGMQKLTFGAMATRCTVQFHGVTPPAAKGFCQAVIHWVADFESRYSRFIPDSIIGRINAAAGEHWVDIDPETERLLGFCNELVFFTRGAFDPTALPLIKLWNWKQQPVALPEEATIAGARELVGWSKVQRRPGAIFLPRKGMCLDLGGIGKEDFGQDVRALGRSAERDHWRVGLENAHKPGSCWQAVKVTDAAVATSGDYHRSFEFQGRRYSHIVDPRIGYPVNNGVRAVSVIAPSCTVAGILTTSAMILGPKDGLHLIESYANAAGSITTNKDRIHSKKFHEHIAA